MSRGFSAVVVWSLAGLAGAQESYWTPAATQPGRGQWTGAVRAEYTRYQNDPTGLGRRVDESVLRARLNYGLTRDVSFTAEIPFVHRETETNDAGRALGLGGTDAGAGDFVLTAKWRFWQHDTSGIDTQRLAAFANLETPTGTGDLSSHSWNPGFGAVYTGVRGRHGLNQAASYTFATGTDANPLAPGQGTDDALRFDTSYLFRLYPERYTGEEAGAAYIVLEHNGVYETNGDVESLISPGLLWEASNWAGEISVRLPLIQEVDHRPERAWGVGFGVRILF
ncbi:MAG: hypothetical protein EA378_06140 [Phycisphaerales bacterium]|nr:MAG: hypothetical protein EA378_06140 [Phycisphaerales bacterium]